MPGVKPVWQCPIRKLSIKFGGDRRHAKLPNLNVPWRTSRPCSPAPPPEFSNAWPAPVTLGGTRRRSPCGDTGWWCCCRPGRRSEVVMKMGWRGWVGKPAADGEVPGRLGILSLRRSAPAADGEVAAVPRRPRPRRRCQILPSGACVVDVPVAAVLDVFCRRFEAGRRHEASYAVGVSHGCCQSHGKPA